MLFTEDSGTLYIKVITLSYHADGMGDSGLDENWKFLWCWISTCLSMSILTWTSSEKILENVSKW